MRWIFDPAKKGVTFIGHTRVLVESFGKKKLMLVFFSRFSAKIP